MRHGRGLFVDVPCVNYTKTRLQALLEMYKDCDGVGEKRGVSVMLYRARIASG